MVCGCFFYHLKLLAPGNKIQKQVVCSLTSPNIKMIIRAQLSPAAAVYPAVTVIRFIVWINAEAKHKSCFPQLGGGGICPPQLRIGQPGNKQWCCCTAGLHVYWWTSLHNTVARADNSQKADEHTNTEIRNHWVHLWQKKKHINCRFFGWCS